MNLKKKKRKRKKVVDAIINLFVSSEIIFTDKFFDLANR